MDESLSEFKEKKGSCKGPKNSQKPSENIVKLKKKLPKRIKGQKDIRTALKSKKSEQLTYAKEFDEVCKQAGVDIDSEQLQLAVALSKSLNSAEDNVSNASQRPLNSQERSKKIRATLKEYGFAVPDIKQNSKKLKKLRKKYKLLLSTDTEKQQIISDRYAQVLFTNTCNSYATDENIDFSLKKCYYIATGITYMSIQNNSIFYVDDLVERSTSKGSLLRDWAGIPGRPESPIKRETLNMNISEIECSQEELNIVLSGTLKSAKDVLRDKIVSKLNSTPTIVIDVDNTNAELHELIVDKNYKTLVNEESADTKSIDVSKNKSLFLSNRVRSCSPDIFDDEVSLIIDSNNDFKNNSSKTKVHVLLDLTEDDHKNVQSSQNIEKSVENRNGFVMDLTQTENYEINYNNDSLKQNIETKSLNRISLCSERSNFARRNSNDLMEITECVGISTSKINPKTNDQSISELCQGTNKPRRYSDELMKVIECVAISCSQLNSNNYNLEATNLQIANNTKRKSNDLMEITECVASTSHCIPLEVEAKIDLTQNSDDDKTTVVGGIINNIIDNIDLSQSSNSVDELPVVHMTESNRSLDDTIILNSDEIIVNNPSSVKTVISEPCSTTTAEHTLDLTDTPQSPFKIEDNDKSSNKSFFDDFDYNHSDDATKETLEKSVQSDNSDILPKESEDNDEVDLTQSSNSSVVNVEQNSDNCSMLMSKNSLGKNDDVSVDYDEMYDVIVNNGSDVRSLIYEMTDENDAETESENISQNSQGKVFDISDSELKYPLNQSTHDAAFGNDCDGISDVKCNLSVSEAGSSFDKEKDVPNYTIDRSMSESFLPIVKVKSNTDIQTNSEERFKTPVNLFSKEKVVTPFKAFISKSVVTIDTPTCNEYIVKTDQVTPILDYASMSTPERNRELGKYGLKPFKRKRAIQLLTHLYNQTHPTVDACIEDLPSPSKRRKPSQPSPKKLSPVKSPRKFKSPKKSNSPRKLIKSPKNSPELIDYVDGNRENVYEVTNELPEIKPIECSEEDWVFQKREKAKIHTCRVPLHIALHNYVSCRRRLQEAILRYEPVNIDVIHKELVASGHRYDPKDLLKYLDKKCITVKTADNNARNRI